MCDIRKVGIVGLGTMGTGISIVVTRAGFETILVDQNEHILESSLQQIANFFKKSVEKKKITEEKAKNIINSIKTHTEYKYLSECDVIIEAVYEDFKTKKLVFQELNKICLQKTIFVSNTSTLSITSLAAASNRPDRFIGMHFCLPAQVMKLVEVTRGLQTSDETFQTAMNFGKALGQTCVLTKDAPGFILNRFIVAFNNMCIKAYENNLASKEDIDKAVKLGLGYPMGPFELLDYIGLDTQLRVSLALFEQTKDIRYWPPSIVSKMVDAGYLGRKTGKGFYNYDRISIFGA